MENLKREVLELTTEIKSLKDGRTLVAIKKEDKKLYYKLQNLSDKLGLLKAKLNGNFVTKDDLIEYRKLIIFLMNKSNFRGYLKLQDAMKKMLTAVENKEFIFKTKRGIKNILAEASKGFALETIKENLMTSNGFDCLENNTLNTPLLAQFQSHRLDVLMS